MKNLFTTTLVISAFTLYGCTNQTTQSALQDNYQACLGDSDLPGALEAEFHRVQDEKLLSSTLGNPMEGKLCQGQVYESKDNSQVTIFRAWNSTNPHSNKGNWWAFERPQGKVAQYRTEYEICYQWSPLDKLMSCTLNPGVKVVVGTGQSAKCSEHLAYPVSDKKQIFISDASASVFNCSVFDGEFKWSPVEQ